MPIQTSIKWRDFVKTIEYFANLKFGKYFIIPKKGSARRIELFQGRSDTTPCEFLVIHQDKVVWSKDLEKTCAKLGVSEEEFIERTKII